MEHPTIWDCHELALVTISDSDSETSDSSLDDDEALAYVTVPIRAKRENKTLYKKHQRLWQSMPADSEPESFENKTCIYCCTAEPNILIRPCNHLDTCMRCMHDLLLHFKSGLRCASCRDPVNDIIRVYPTGWANQRTAPVINH